MDEKPQNRPLGEGLHPLAQGMVANVVTYLEMTRPLPPRPVPASASGARLAPLANDVARYRTIFRRIGERWMWVARLEMPDSQLAAHLADADVAVFAVVAGDRDCGLLEMDFRTDGEAELVYFGLVDEALGRGLGRWLMEQALVLAWRRSIRRFWLHTCTLDHPGAVAFYRRSGFTPTHAEVEVLADPRLSGIYPRDAFPDLPPAD